MGGLKKISKKPKHWDKSGEYGESLCGTADSGSRDIAWADWGPRSVTCKLCQKLLGNPQNTVDCSQCQSEIHLDYTPDEYADYYCAACREQNDRNR